MPVFMKRIFFIVFLPLFVIILFNRITQNSRSILHDILAAAPILVVLLIMIVFRIGGQYAGPVGLLTGILVA